jgi:hypothetical protein
MTIEQIAKVAHEINKAYCESIGDHSQKSWHEAEQWQRESAINGVNFSILNPEAPASAQHDAWMKDKINDGWQYGKLKDPAKKEHPCLVPYGLLPTEQKSKDYLFKQVVASLIPYFS